MHKVCLLPALQMDRLSFFSQGIVMEAYCPLAMGQHWDARSLLTRAKESWVSLLSLDQRQTPFTPLTGGGLQNDKYLPVLVCSTSKL